MAARSSSSVTWAIDTAVGQLQALDAHDLEAELGEEARHVFVADRLIRRDHADRLAPYRCRARSQASAPVATCRPVMPLIWATNSRLPSTPSQNVSAHMPMTM